MLSLSLQKAKKKIQKAKEKTYRKIRNVNIYNIALYWITFTSTIFFVAPKLIIILKENWKHLVFNIFIGVLDSSSSCKWCKFSSLCYSECLNFISVRVLYMLHILVSLLCRAISDLLQWSLLASVRRLFHTSVFPELQKVIQWHAVLNVVECFN